MTSSFRHNSAAEVSNQSLTESLLTAIGSLRATTQPEVAVDMLLLAFSEASPDVAVGVCMVLPFREQKIIARWAGQSRSASTHPSRLFPDWDHEEVTPLANGSTLHVAAPEEQVLKPHQGPIGLLTSVLEVVLDVGTAFAKLDETRQEAEMLRQQIVQAEKLASLGQIAASIAHEINNPLTSILAYSDYLIRKWERTGNAGDDLDRLRKIAEAADRILSFSRDLISYSRPTVSVPGPVSVHEALERALSFCEHLIAREGICVEKDLAPVQLVSGVMGHLVQVFVNLTTNSCQAMKEGGKIRIRTRMSADGEQVLVEVEDDGPGIDAAHIDQLFEPYFTTKHQEGGTGLGLPIVRRIVESHGGIITARRLAKGALFVVSLPVSARVSQLVE